MANLNEIKGKIGSVKKTRQITKAMQLVAASKMRQFQKKAVHTRDYAWDLLNLLQGNLFDRHQSVYMRQRKEGKTMFILYTSDKGLCGGLNTQLIKALFNSKRWKETPGNERLLVTIGKKSYEYARYNNIDIEKEYLNLNEEMTPFDSLDFIKDILGYWSEGHVKEVIMVAPHYKNSFTFYPIVKTYLPFSHEMVQEHLGVDEEEVDEQVFEPTKNRFMYYEPSQERMIDVMIEQVTQTLFLQSFYELKAAEYSSRMIAMQNATDNADGLIKDLTLTFNKARQSAITQQLAELSGGMAAV
jgi:F-type H+-transporting ATPase subunit gamma